VSHGYVDIVQKIVNKGVNVNAKAENEKCHLHLACENNHHKTFSILLMVLDLPFISFFLFHRS
jgi:ankyrin repeat protein